MKISLAVLIGLTLLVADQSPADAQVFTTLYTFNGTNGNNPGTVILAQGRDGNIYGTAGSGGVYGLGTIFRESPDGISNTVIYNFTGTDGQYPESGLTLARDGNLYGTASGGGANGHGVLFRVTSAGVYTVLYNFTNGTDGGSPMAPPIEATSGNLYGISSAGVYRYTPSGTFSTIYSFTPYPIYYLTAPLLESSDGDLYMTTWEGGSLGCGSVVKLSLAGVVKSQHNFGCYVFQTSGYNTIAPVIQASDGSIYGANNAGGIYEYGTAFKLDGKTGILTVLHSFPENQDDGNHVVPGLVQATDGNLYGVTTFGGTTHQGSIYSVKLDGTYIKLYSISDVQAEPDPESSLIQHTNGKFYGVTIFGGASRGGTLFSFDMGLGAFVTFVRSQGKIGATTQVLGQGLTGTTSVTFNGVAATSFSVVSDTYMTAVVPTGATTGPAVVTTPTGTLTGNKSFRITK
jgi:uncharacterized repeat protein (TIGR03803 family)